MTYLTVMEKNLTELADTIEEADIASLTQQGYIICIHNIIRRTKAFKIALMKGADQRDCLVGYAEAELKAGERLLDLFAADSRYAVVKKKISEMEKGRSPCFYTWEDFMSFWEQKGQAGGCRGFGPRIE